MDSWEIPRIVISCIRLDHVLQFQNKDGRFGRARLHYNNMYERSEGLSSTAITLYVSLGEFHPVSGQALSTYMYKINENHQGA